MPNPISLDSEWNRCRSDMKWLEYAAHWVAPLCADLPPYVDVRDGETGLLYRTPEELAAQLDRLLGDDALRRHIADRAAGKVRTERLERRHAPKRLAFYAEAAAAAGRILDPGPHPELATAGFGETTGDDFPGSRYRRADGGEVARLLYAGLILMRDGNSQEARRYFAEATRRDPASYLAWMHAGNAEPDHARAVPLLRRAVDLAPESCASSYLLGARLLAAGEESGTAELRRCALLAPAFGAAQALLGERALATGDEARLDAAYSSRLWMRTLGCTPLPLCWPRPTSPRAARRRPWVPSSELWQPTAASGRLDT